MVLRPGAATLLLLLTAAAPAAAQSEPPVGVRAAGMAGAFTAVADDASATFWNPAGLASGSFFSLSLDQNSLDRQNGGLIGIAIPALGLSYTREKVAGTFSDKVPGTFGPGASGAGAPMGRNTLVAHQAGVTLVQSIGSRLAVGSTLKLVHAAGANRFDADLGIMASGSIGNVGLSVRNLREPAFTGTGGSPVRLQRRVRAGVALHARDDLTVAADVDFTTADTPLGDWREAAMGLESHPMTRAWLRGGVKWNTTGARRSPVESVGGSYALSGSVLADVQWSFGSADGDRGWGAGLRFVY